MEIEFGNEQYGKIYSIEMSEEFFKDFEEFEKRSADEDKEFDEFLKEKDIKL